MMPFLLSELSFQLKCKRYRTLRQVCKMKSCLMLEPNGRTRFHLHRNRLCYDVISNTQLYSTKMKTE